jgi:hypothetical protein
MFYWKSIAQGGGFAAEDNEGTAGILHGILQNRRL